MKIKHTPWFNGTEKPARSGVYERRYSKARYYCKFDGTYWYTASEIVELAERAHMVSAYNNLPWRGVTKESVK